MAIQRNQGGYGSKGTTANPSGVKKNEPKGFLDNLGNAVSSFTPENKSLIDSEAVKTSNRLSGTLSTVSNSIANGAEGVAKSTPGRLVEQALKLGTTPPRSQREIDASKGVNQQPPAVQQQVAPQINGTINNNPAIPQPTYDDSSKPTISTEPGRRLGYFGGPIKEYNNPAGVSISTNSPGLGIDQQSKDYLDKVISYNRRPDVIEGFARNAALSQARYDDYFAKKNGTDPTSLQNRIDQELSKRYPNPDVLDSLGKSLELQVRYNDNKGNGTDPVASARLGLDTDKAAQARNKDFISAVTKTDNPMSANAVFQTGKRYGVKPSLSDILSYSQIDDTDRQQLSQATDAASMIPVLQRIGIGEDDAIGLVKQHFGLNR